MTRTPECRTPPPAHPRVLAAVTCCGDVLTSAHLPADTLVDELLRQLPPDIALLAARHPVTVYECVLDESSRASGYYHNGRRYVPRAVVAEFWLSASVLITKVLLQ